MTNFIRKAVEVKPRKGVELFGTIYKPNARWWCLACKRANVSPLALPLNAKEVVACKGCHRTSTFTIDLSEVPRVWGGTKEEVTS